MDGKRVNPLLQYAENDDGDLVQAGLMEMHSGSFHVGPKGHNDDFIGLGLTGKKESEVAQSCPTLCDPMDCTRLLHP